MNARTFQPKLKTQQNMARLTGFSRLLIVALLIAGVYFAVTKFLPDGKMPSLGGSGDATTTTSTTTGSSSDDNAASGSATAPAPAATSGNATAFQKAAFNFTPPAPIGGKLKGVVELGATGFNSFIIRVDAQKNWKLEKADYGASLVYEKMTSGADVKAGLKQYISEMLAYGVNGRDIHFVISSGAKKVSIIDEIISTLAAMNYTVNTVTAEQEGTYALRCVLPKDYSGRAFVVDIGSGNTKISWMQNGQVRALESYGAKYTQNGTTADVVRADINAKCKQVPSNLTGTCFIIGGVPFEFAKKVRKDKTERFTVLPSPADIKPEGDKQVNGHNIYNSIASATGCKQFVFDWDANFSIGFLLGLPSRGGE
jgi:hypothetical protein